MVTGAKLHTFEGHDAPVHSICPHTRDNVHVRTLDYFSFLPIALAVLHLMN